nr:MAG: hypothetical protein DIU68_04615 [Chloroflexota bacterium]
MKRLLLLFAVSLLLAGGALSAAPARQAASAQPPAILDFSADLEAIALADAEAGETTTVLSWSTLNMLPEHRLALEAFVINDWVSLLAEGETLEPRGEREITVTHPANFGPPTYRLSILDASGAVLDQRTLVIPYDTTGEETPAIVAFESSATEVSPDASGVALTPVSWSVEGRTPASYLAFDQILADGQLVAVDLPRLSLWVPSQGQGVVAPVVAAGDTRVTLVLRVIDGITGTTLDSRELVLPVAGMLTATAVPPEATPEPEPEPAGPAQIFYFEPARVGDPATGEQFTLVWEVAGAPQVRIEYVDPAGTLVTRSGLKPLDSLSIPLDEVGFVNGDRYQFTLTATDTAGNALTDANGVPVSSVIEFPAESAITINAFSANVTSLEPGAPVTLSWDVSGAQNITLSRVGVQGGQFFSQVLGENLDASGSLEYTLPAAAEEGLGADTATFLLIAEDDTSARRTAYVRLPVIRSGATIESFNTDRTSATLGDTVALSWSTSGATSADLYLIRAEGSQPELIAQTLPPSGSIMYTFPADGDPATYGPLVTFRLDVRDAAGATRSALANVSFSTSGLSIDLFTASPNRLAPGETLALAWQVRGATSVAISQHNPVTGDMETIATDLPLAGSMQATISPAIPASSLPIETGFVLHAESAEGEMHSADALITIVAPENATKEATDAAGA